MFGHRKEMFDTVKPIIFGVAHRLEKETKGAAVAPTETADEHILHWLLYVERTLAQWRELESSLFGESAPPPPPLPRLGSVRNRGYYERRA